MGIKRIKVNAYVAFIIIALVGAGATQIVLHTISDMERTMTPSALADIP